MLKRRLFALVASLTIVAMVAGCGGGKQEQQAGGEQAAPQQQQQQQAAPSQPAEEPVKQEIVVNIGEEPPSLDPGTAQDSVSFDLLTNLFEGLTRVNPEGKVVPGMATEWSTSPDGMVWTFKLRDAKWSNGDPVTAHDFEYAWKRALDPALASPYAYQLYYIKNGQAFNEGTVTDASQVGVRAVDDKTLEVTLETPTPYFLSLTNFPTYFPVNKKVAESNEKWAAEASSYVSNGPFKLAEWVHNDKLVMVKNPDYWDAATVKLEKITGVMVVEASTSVTMFANNEIDLNESHLPPADLPQLLASGEAKKTALLGTYYYLFNASKKPFDDPRVRKALSLAIDRQLIVEQVTKGGQIPAYAFVPPGVPDVTGDFRKNAGDYVPSDMQANIAEAKRLLAEAGYPDGKGFPDSVILYNTSEGHKAIAEAIQAMWKQNLGLSNITLQNQEWGVFLETREHLNYDMARAGWIGDYLDPMTFIDMFTSDSGNNDTGWKSAEYDELVRIAKTSSDQKVRMEAMHKAEKMLIADEAVIAPIYYYVHEYQEKPWVKGVIHPAIGGHDYKWAYVEKH